MYQKDKDPRRFYVYVIFRTDGSPCYIGKGQGRRWLQHKSGLQKHHNRRLAKIIADNSGEIPIVKIRTDLSNEEACRIEIALIAALGRGHRGPLVNMTDGGEGAPGYYRSKELRERAGRLSGAARKGKKHGPMPPEWREAVRKGKIGTPMHPKTAAGLLRAAKAPKSQSHKDAISLATKRTWQRRRDNPDESENIKERLRAGWIKRKAAMKARAL